MSIDLRYTEEVPAGTNEYLSQLEEDSGKIVVAHSTSTKLNRYRFFWRDVASIGSRPTNVSHLLRQLYPMLGWSPYWFLVWPNAQPSSSRFRFLLSKRTSEGWVVFQEDEICVAKKAVGSLLAAPEGYAVKDGGGYFVLFDWSAEPSRFVTSCTIPTLTDLATSHQLRPSRQFMGFLEEEGKSCVYFMLDEFARTEVIVLTTKELEIPGDVAERLAL